LTLIFYLPYNTDILFGTRESQKSKKLLINKSKFKRENHVSITEINIDQNDNRQSEKSDSVFLSLHQAAKMTGYHQDYLGQMARSGKLEARKVGRNWQTTKLAIDKMLGRVPEVQAYTPQSESKVAPVQMVSQSSEVQQVKKVITQPGAVVSASGVAHELKAIESSVRIQEVLKRTVVVRRLINSPDAGPNLQEALAFEVAAVPQPIAIRGIENKNIFYRLNKLSRGKVLTSAVQPAQEKYKRAKKLSDDILAQPTINWSGRAVVFASCVMLFAVGYFGWSAWGAGSQSNNFSVVDAADHLNPEAADKMVAGESTTAPQLQLNQGPGQGIVFAGKTEVAVNHPGTELGSVIMVTFRGDYGGRYWVSDQRSGQFTVKLSVPATQDTKFDYWVMDKEQRDPP
jgi:hypothetical protein